MNRKQLIIAWVIGVSVSIILMNKVGSYIGHLIEALMMCLPIIIIGGLLIYTLRDSKK